NAGSTTDDCCHLSRELTWRARRGRWWRCGFQTGWCAGGSGGEQTLWGTSITG
ncbi:unnamed protein product, partial [Closterium sp. NIES-64]